MNIRFFVDNGLGHGLVSALREFGYENVEHLRDTFAEDCPDEEWLKYVGENGLCLITRDRNIRRKPNEKQALVKYKIVAFYLLGNEMSAREISKQLVNSWSEMEEKAREWKKKGVAAAFNVRRGGGKLIFVPLN